MKIFVDTSHFLGQIATLSEKYRKTAKDYADFQTSFSIDQWVNLGKWFYKFRIKNSSIPTGKRGGYRIIIFAPREKTQCVPVCIYSKTEREDIGFPEILRHFSEITRERTKNQNNI